MNESSKSTSAEVSQDDPDSRWYRRPLFWVGSCMWVLVLIGVISIWYGRSLQRDAEEALQRAARQQATPDPQRSNLSITLPITSSEEEQVIDISKLLENPSTVPSELPLWDPAGVQDFSLMNYDGRYITKQDLLGRPWVACFIFTRCLGPCPTITRQMKEIQDRLKEYDFRLVTFTVDPARDTPEVLAEYARINGADPDKWYFLTGDQSEIYGLIHHSFRMPVQEVTGPNRKEGYEIIHSTNLILVDERGVVVGKFNGAKGDEVAALRRKLEKLAEQVAVLTEVAPNPVVNTVITNPTLSPKEVENSSAE